MSNTTENTDTRVTRNLIITGFGFINRIRTISPQNGQPYVAATCALEEGNAKALKELYKTYFECRVVGQQALDLLKQQFTDENGELNAPDDTTVRAAVTLGGCAVYPYVYSKGEKKGETGVSLRSRLLRIRWMSVNGEEVYRERDAESNSVETTSNTTPAVHSESSQKPIQSTELDDATQDVMLSQPMVTLDKNDVQFHAKKSFLKANGYRWDKQNVAWVKRQPEPVNTAPLHEAAHEAG